MNKYRVLIIRNEDNETIKVLCEQGVSKREAEAVERGAKINLNYVDYYTELELVQE